MPTCWSHCMGAFPRNGPVIKGLAQLSSTDVCGAGSSCSADERDRVVGDRRQDAAGECQPDCGAAMCRSRAGLSLSVRSHGPTWSPCMSAEPTPDSRASPLLGLIKVALGPGVQWHRI